MDRFTFDLDARRRIAESMVRIVDDCPDAELIDCLALAIMEERIIYGGSVVSGDGGILDTEDAIERIRDVFNNVAGQGQITGRKRVH
jgi:hypothetical protein